MSLPPWRKVLSRSLNFCPTPKEINRLELLKDIFEFGRKMKCKFCANGGEDNEISDRDIRFKIHWNYF